MRLYIYAFVIGLFFSSCEYDHLYYVNERTATVEVRIDWTPALLNKYQLNGITGVAYDSESGNLRSILPTFVGTDSVLEVALPIGTWDLIFFNNTPSEYADIQFNGFKKRSTLQANYVSARLTRPATKSEDKELPVIASPEILAAAAQKNITITQKQIDVFYDRPDIYHSHEHHKYAITAERKIMTWVFTGEVRGLKYAAGAPFAHLIHNHAGFNIGLDERIGQPTVLQEFVWNNRTWIDADKVDGKIRAEVTSFAPSPFDADEHTLDVNFVLLDGKDYLLRKTFGNEAIKDSIDPRDGVLKHWVHFVFELPESVGSGGGSFDPEASEWDDVIVEL